MGSVANSMRLISFHNTLTYLPVVSAITLVSKAYVARKYSHIKPDQREKAIKDPSELYLYRMSWVDCVFRIIPIANLAIAAKHFYKKWQVNGLLERASAVNLTEQSKRGLLEQAAALGSAIAERELALNFYQEDKETQIHKMRIAVTAWDTVAFRHLGQHHFLLQNRDGITKKEKEEEKEKGLEFYRLAAGQGDVISQDFLGEYYSSIGNLEQSKRFYSLAFKQSEKLNTPADKYRLGFYHFRGIQGVVNKDLTKAVDYCKDAAAEGYQLARKQLGNFYRCGLNDERGVTIVEKNLKRAQEIYQEGCAQKQAWAQYALGVLHETNQIEVDAKEVDANSHLREAARLYKLAADQGYVEAQGRLGYLYENGKGIEQSYTEAVRLYQLAQDRDLYANYALGSLYERGRGVRKDLMRAAKFYQEAAKQISPAKYALGRLYERGDGVAQDRVKAFKLYKSAAQRLQSLVKYGLAEAQLALAKCYLYGHGLEADQNRALEYLELAVQQGDPNAEFFLGSLYEHGPLPQNMDKAHGLYFSAGHEKRHPDALYALGALLEKGRPGVEPNVHDAVGYYREAAEKGHPDAQYALGRLYGPHGAEEIVSDIEESIKWYCSAADQGSAQAQLALGKHYQFGSEPDMKRAFEYYQLAANQGFAEAEARLGICFIEGKGVPVHLEVALGWCIRAAEHGCSYGVYRLAVAKEANGETAEALELYKRAANLGHVLAREAVKRLEAAAKALPQ